MLITIHSCATPFNGSKRVLPTLTRDRLVITSAAKYAQLATYLRGGK